MATPYNPLDKINLGRSIQEALLDQPVRPLPSETRFPGAGIYAIYYVGDFSAYQVIAARNQDGKFELPIYVGEAVPEGSRKGGLLRNSRPTYKLHARLRQHARSIEDADNLDIRHFYYRCLVVDDIWIPLGEALMIDTFAPVWNKKIEGFGIHTPGGNRPQTTSAWDTLHPGRPFVRRVNLLPNPTPRERWIEIVREYLEKPHEEQASEPTLETGEED